MYGYDSEPLLSYKLEKKYFLVPALKFHSWVAFPSLQGTLSLCSIICLLCCDSNLIHILPIYTVTAVVFPAALPCLSLQQLTNDLFLSSFLVWTPLCSQCLSVYCVFGSSEIYALLYGSSFLSPNWRRELKNGPNIHTDIDLACLMIDFLTQWLTDGSGLLNVQKHTLLPVHQTLKCPHNLKSLHARWLQSNEWTWLGYGSLLLFPCAGS